ncbi:Arm DNA-binding domain-containing protein, partial [Pseudomonas aeruginosa]|uniref:Arm DNA-binding domain-containing protein n=2 Tax=Pseudomonadota TaxID=1224 RepID=UPI001179C237
MAKIPFTASRVGSFRCPPNKPQAFLWDATTPGLGLRTTPAGKPSYVFQGLYQSKTIRITIGSPLAWTIADAQLKARELQRQIDEGLDPR